MPIRPFSEWQQRGEHFHTHTLKQCLPYAFTWEAICPITNLWIEGYSKPSDEELHYKNFRETTHEHHPMDFCIWIDEPYLKEDGKFAPFLSDLQIRINDGDDSYWHKEFEFTIENYDEVFSKVLEEFELLKLATTQEELIETAMSMDFLDY